MRYMNKDALLLFVTAMFSQTTIAEPTTLYCVLGEDTPAGTMVIDLENNKMEWEKKQYKIVSINDKFVTAFHSNKGVGGTVLVMHRITGAFVKSTTHRAADIVDPESLTEDIETYSRKGRCNPRAL